MSYQFNDEDKEVREFAQSMPFGVSEVQITGAIADVNQNDKDYIEVGVVNREGIEDSVKLWFTGGAANISFNTLRAVAVHCISADDESLKEEARKRVDAVKDNDELAAVISDICSGKKCWFTKYYDAKGATYTNDYGTFKSVQKSIYGYEPKLKPELMPKPADNQGDPLAGAEDITGTDAAAGIPKDEDWAK